LTIHGRGDFETVLKYPVQKRSSSAGAYVSGGVSQSDSIFSKLNKDFDSLILSSDKKRADRSRSPCDKKPDQRVTESRSVPQHLSVSVSLGEGEVILDFFPLSITVSF
jgi:hypothetical protein